jgi:hypothetical protein
MAPPPARRTIDRVLTGKGSAMLEWKARILTLLVSAAIVWDLFGAQIDNNWNW